MKKITPNKFKIILVGSLGVGKTSLVNKITTDKELNEPLTSIYTYSLFVGGSQVELNIWDTLGQEKSGKIPPSFYRDAQGAIIVYDVTDDRSYIEVDHWIQSVKFLAGEIPLVIVGNKCEIYRRKILTGRASDKAIHYAASYVETSVKQNTKIDELFEEMARRCLKSPPDDLEIEKEVVEEMSPVIEELAGTIVERHSDEIAETVLVEENSEMSITSVVPFSEPNDIETQKQEVQSIADYSIFKTETKVESNESIPQEIETTPQETETTPQETETTPQESVDFVSQEPSEFASQESVEFISEQPVEFVSEQPVEFVSEQPVEFASEEIVEEDAPQIPASSIPITPTEVSEKVAEKPLSEEKAKDIFEDLHDKSEHWKQIQQKIESVSSSFIDESDDSDTIPKVRPSLKKTGFVNQAELTQRILKKTSTIKQIEKDVEVETSVEGIPPIIRIKKSDITEQSPVSQAHSESSEKIVDPLIPKAGEFIDIDIIDEQEQPVSEQQVPKSEAKIVSDPYIKPAPVPSQSPVPPSEMSFSNYKDEQASQIIKNLTKDTKPDTSIDKNTRSSVLGLLDTTNKTTTSTPPPTKEKPSSSLPTPSIPSTRPLESPPAEKLEEEPPASDPEESKRKKSFIPKP